MSRPRSLAQFQAEFHDEAACAEFLIRHRWPAGFVCPTCRGCRAARLRSRAYTFECLGCGRQTSVTAGTILHRTKLPLTTWFWTAHLIATHSNGISAFQLANQIGVKEDTAWLLLHKFRAAMTDRERQPLSGVVEIDQTEIPFRTDDSDGAPDGRVVILGAVEIVDRDTGEPPKTDFNRPYKNTRPRRVRLAVIADETKESIHAFVRENIAPGTTLLTDGHGSYLGLNEGPETERYVLDRRVVGKMAAHLVLFWVHRVFSLMKRWGMGTFHGFRAKHLDRYLEEYAFRFNRRYWRRVSFERILGLAVDHVPHGYAAVVGRKPRPNRAKPPKRLGPRNRKTADGIRRDAAATHAMQENLLGDPDSR
jgi:transposase-like protein